ncbi:MAG: 30S ribosomal protein S3 [Gammaproteobacteria bacterium]
MGQKVHPIGFRLGISTSHSANWYAKGNKYRENLLSDLKIRKAIETSSSLSRAAISKVEIERKVSRVHVILHSGRAAQIVGRKGENLEQLRTELAKEGGVGKNELTVEVKPVFKPDVDAKLIALNIARQLEQRVMFRRAMRRAVSSARDAGVDGIRVQIAGRLGGADIARTERYLEGRVPLHTLKARIDYGTAIARTVYGIIGIKVWIFLGEEVSSKKMEHKNSEGAE